MKLLTKIVLFIFLLFLVTPSIVSAIDENIDTSYFFNMSEEETHSSVNEVKIIPSIYSVPLLLDFEGLERVQFSVLNDRKVKSMKPKVIIEPPELV